MVSTQTSELEDLDRRLAEAERKRSEVCLALQLSDVHLQPQLESQANTL